MREKGTVIEVSGDRATIAIQPSESCIGCPACTICHPAEHLRVMDVNNDIGAHLGDEVYFEIAPHVRFLAHGILFGIPIALGLVGIALGSRCGELITVVCGISGFILGLVVAKVANTMFSRKHILPRIVDIVCRESA